MDQHILKFIVPRLFLQKLAEERAGTVNDAMDIWTEHTVMVFLVYKGHSPPKAAAPELRHSKPELRSAVGV